jgi:transposase
MPRLDTATRYIVIGRLHAGVSQNAVARLYNIHRNTMCRLLQRYQQSGSTTERQRSGRPRITSAAQDRYIRELHMRNRTVTARETASNVPGLRSNIDTDSQKSSPWKRLTRQTSLLWRSTETSASTYKGPMVQQSKELGPATWRRGWFSDESRFTLQKRVVHTRVYRRRNERFARNCVLEVDHFGVGSVMMRGTISYARKTQLVHIPGNLNAAQYRDEILTPHMLPAMNLRREVFQHDNARSHTAGATVDFLANQSIRVLPGRLDHQIWTQ